jgi:hypothetical protein
MYLKEALPLVKLLEAEPPRMGSQPLAWEPVRARAVSFLSAIPPCPIPNDAIWLHLGEPQLSETLRVGASLWQCEKTALAPPCPMPCLADAQYPI